MPSKEQFDYVVIGAGPAGSEAVRALAVYAGKAGARIALVEREQPGGTCLNWGCIPTKALASAARRLSEARRSSECGLFFGEPRVEAPRLFAKVQEIVSGLRSDMLFSLTKLPIDYIVGEARIGPDGTISIADSKGTARVIEGGKVLLATGSKAASLPGIQLDGETVLDSRALLSRMFAAKPIPHRLAVIGGGAIGCEFAWIFATLGSAVTVIEVAHQLLPGMDKDVSGQLAASFAKQGITVRLAASVKGVEKINDAAKVTLEGGEPVFADLVLLSVGRTPDLSFLDPPALGISIVKGRAAVDDVLQTTRPGWYAAGDLVPGPMLAYTASAQGAVAARNMTGAAITAETRTIPVAVFCQPECAQTGRIDGPDLVSARAFFKANSRARCEDADFGLVKIFVRKNDGVITGFSLIGPHASELVGEATVLVEEKVSVKRYLQMLHVHPVFGEALADAAQKVMERL